MFVRTGRDGPELVWNGRRRRVVAPVDGQTERDVRVDGVEATVLERVGADLVEQTDAASLVPQIKKHAAIGAPDLLQPGFELLAAVAAQ